MSVSDNLNESPTLLADAFTLFKNSSEGALTFNFPLSNAVLNLTKIIEFLLISSSTLGTVTCSSLKENGSKPAKKAEVSRTMTRLRWPLFLGFHSVPLKSSRLLSRS